MLTHRTLVEMESSLIRKLKESKEAKAEMAKCLLELQNRGDYLRTHKSFGAYVEDVLGISKSKAYHIMSKLR